MLALEAELDTNEIEGSRNGAKAQRKTPRHDGRGANKF